MSAASIESRRLPGDRDIWVMVLGDSFVFGLYFVVYMVFRAFSPEEFADAQRHLNIDIGVINTIVLLASSLFVALGVGAVRQRAIAHLALGLLGLGIVFRELRDPTKQRLTIVEQGALYWHMIDLLWVIIFAVFYLMR